MARSTLELSETLAASLNIKDEIVGLTTTAVLLEDGQSSTFKSHGDVVIPFSALASGQLSAMMKKTEGMEGIPSFNLVTSNLDSYLKSYQVAAAAAASIVESEEEEMSFSDESASTVHEVSLYTEAFVHLMEKSDEFDPFEKNSLLRFGIENAEQGNILYRASFRVA